MKFSTFFLGMAVQAFISAILIASGQITATPAQQGMAGLIFLGVGLLISLLEKQRR